jgi:hypothetical protein
VDDPIESMGHAHQIVSAYLRRKRGSKFGGRFDLRIRKSLTAENSERQFHD